MTFDDHCRAQLPLVWTSDDTPQQQVSSYKVFFPTHDVM